MKKFQIPLMKKFKKTAIVVVCAVALAAIPPVSNVSATTMQEAQDSKNEAEGNKKDAQNVLDGLQERQNQLISDVEVLDKQVSDIQTKITAKEEEENTVSVRSRFAGDEGAKSLDDFIAAITEEIKNRENRKVEVEEQK